MKETFLIETFLIEIFHWTNVLRNAAASKIVVLCFVVWD